MIQGANGEILSGRAGSEALIANVKLGLLVGVEADTQSG